MKALNKDIFREIKNTFSRFISIFLLAMLGVAFLAGLKTSEPSMKRSMNQYYDQQKLMDVRLLSTLGLSEEDVAAAFELDCVETVEAVRTIDAFADNGGSEVIVKLHTCPVSLNQLTLLGWASARSRRRVGCGAKHAGRNGARTWRRSTSGCGKRKLC